MCGGAGREGLPDITPCTGIKKVWEGGIWGSHTGILTRSWGEGGRDKDEAEGGTSVSGPSHSSFSPRCVRTAFSLFLPLQVCASGLKAVMLAEQSIRTGGKGGRSKGIGGSGLKGV